jgi:hypothetical protein
MRVSTRRFDVRSERFRGIASRLVALIDCADRIHRRLSARWSPKSQRYVASRAERRRLEAELEGLEAEIDLARRVLVAHTLRTLGAVRSINRPLDVGA